MFLIWSSVLLTKYFLSKEKNKELNSPRRPCSLTMPLIHGEDLQINTGRCAPAEGYGNGCVQVLHLMDKNSSEYVVQYSDDSRSHYLAWTYLQSPSK